MTEVISLESEARILARRRRKALMVLLAIVGLLVSLGVGAWFAVTQPVNANRQAAAPPSVDSSRLEKHVRTLASSFFPRSSNHAENLDRAAGYIRGEFER